MVKLKSNHPEEQVHKSIFRILQKTKLLSMATVREVGGKPTSWINTAFFYPAENLELYILTSPESIHGKNLKTNPSVAVNILDTNQIPGHPRQGLQMVGEGKVLTGDEEMKTLEKWHLRMRGGQGFEEFKNKYQHFESKMHKLTINYVKIFDEPTFGEEVWVEVEVVR